MRRREFLGQGAVAALASAAMNAQSAEPDAKRSQSETGKLRGARAEAAEARRHAAARTQRERTRPAPPLATDEAQYPNKIASFTKYLPHNALGEVNLEAYAALQRAFRSGRAEDFEKLILGGTGKLKNPQAAFAFDLQGADSHAFGDHLPPAPAFASAETAAEMVELSWQALLRDVPFEAFGSHALAGEAAAELATLEGNANARQSAAMLFRGVVPGDSVGPFVSQLLWRDVPFGAMTVHQQITSAAAGADYMTDAESWLACQNGMSSGAGAIDAQSRFIRNGRDLGEYVHRDFSYQPYLNAALILIGLKAPFDPANPYNASRTQSGDGTFGSPAILDLVARITINATKTAWYYKWLVSRRLRPEEYGGRVQAVTLSRAAYPLHGQVLHSRALAKVRERFGSYLLPMAYPEGCPAHPAYPAAHAVLAGAAVTMLKAFFDERWELPKPVVAATDGLSLQPWRGEPLTVGGELNKLAANIAMGRCIAGVHWRSDSMAGLKLGESLALNYLEESRALWNESFAGYTVVKFDGSTVVV